MHKTFQSVTENQRANIPHTDSHLCDPFYLVPTRCVGMQKHRAGGANKLAYYLRIYCII